MVNLKKLFADEPGEKVFCLGNEALSRGLVESGLMLCASYPGTPASEIPMTLNKVATHFGFYAEWSTNEANALETAIAGSLANIRSVFVAKHVGLNVAADALMTSGYLGARGGFLMITGDDPSLHSSQNEQDNRWFGRFANLPVIEPADIEEMLNYPKIAFELSEKFGIPVIFRITTRTAHSRGTITLNPLERPEANPNFEKNPQQLVQLPGHARINHTKLLKKIEEITEWAETSPINRIDGEIKGSIGIITSGVAYTYVKEALEFINEESPILKLGLAYPLPPRKITSFLEKFDKVLIIEEVDPFHEILIRSIAQSQGVKTNIIGKDQGLTPLEGELNLRKILEAFKQIEEYAPKIDLSKYEKVDELVAETKGLVPARPPILCAGCPHRATFFGLIRAMKRVKEEVIYVNDIGCYALGISMGVADALLCMGASIGMASGLAHSGIKEMPVAIIGDSTFFHSGINALVNAVYNKSNILVVIVDNYTTAMTGMQDSPRTGITGMGEKGNEISIEETCEGMGVKHIEVVDAYDSKESTRAFHRALEYTEGPSVVISRYPCIQLVLRDKKKKGEKIVPCYVDTEICNGCAICIDRFTCPAMTWAEEPLSTGKYQMVISITECVGCGSCIPVCARKAIKLGPEN